jgi:hypothetical protein
MSLSNATETDLAAKIFQAVALPWDSVVKLDVHLHTGNPGETGVSTDSEANYGDYALVQVDRTAGGFAVSGPQASNVADISFPIAASGTNAITYFSITPRSSTQILVYGALNGGGISVSTGIRPIILAGTLTITFD